MRVKARSFATVCARFRPATPRWKVWLRDEAAKSYDEFAADPTIGIPGEQVMERVRVSYRKRVGKSEDE